MVSPGLAGIEGSVSVHSLEEADVYLYESSSSLVNLKKRTGGGFDKN